MASFLSRIHSMSFFNRLAIVATFSIYLVILAGIFVRVTGSGMGCPDWPKCYGLIVPPTNISQLTWCPEKEYSEGQMIIKEFENNSFILLQAKSSFTSGVNWDNIEELNWKAISDSKHDFASFSPFKTWTEYLNRCLGAISGFFIVLLVVISFFYKRIPNYLFACSLLLICLSLVQYWLGRNVVYSVLESQKITIHFFVALIFIPILLFIVYKSRFLLKKGGISDNSIIENSKLGKKNTFKYRFIKMLKKYFVSFLIFSLFISIIQMFFGTQVRGHVEAAVFEDNNISLVLTSFELLIHRLFVPLILIINVILIVILSVCKNEIIQYKILIEKISLIFILFLLVSTGSYMYFFEVMESVKPKWTTLIHAYSSVMLFTIYISLLLKRVIYKSI